MVIRRNLRIIFIALKSQDPKGIDPIPCLRREMNANPKSDKITILDVSDFSNEDNVSTHKRGNKL